MKTLVVLKMASDAVEELALEPEADQFDLGAQEVLVGTGRGMLSDADLLVAVNTDSQAPIFQVAHFGVVADVLDVLPALAEAARTRKKEHCEHA